MLPDTKYHNEITGPSEVVGYTYQLGYQRPNHNGEVVDSGLKIATEDWFERNLENFSAKLATGKFCNDRRVRNGDTWTSTERIEFYYLPRERLETTKLSSLSCFDDDVYTLKVGAITADEVSFAGGLFGSGGTSINKSYYLYAGTNYWTMSPYFRSIANSTVWVFSITNAGLLYKDAVGASKGIRPVINLRSDIQFKAGTDGTLNNPYEVI